MYVYKTFYVHIYKCMLGLARDFSGAVCTSRCKYRACLLSVAAGGHIYEPNISFFFFLKTKTGSDNVALASLLGFVL